MEETSQNNYVLDRDGKPYDVPEGGSLGLLALGYVGLMVWREKRNKAIQAYLKANAEQQSKKDNG